MLRGTGKDLGDLQKGLQGREREVSKMNRMADDMRDDSKKWAFCSEICNNDISLQGSYSLES